VGTIRKFYARAQARGFDPNSDLPVIKNEYAVDAPESGRPSKQTEENKEEMFYQSPAEIDMAVRRPMKLLLQK
jgi:hypothetical protein